MAQNPGCDGDRFLRQVFDSVIVTPDVIYGHNLSIGGENIDLKMDIYEPWGDTLSTRPVVFIVHGGGFTNGSKSKGRFVKLSRKYAMKGYISVSIDYRLYDLDYAPDSSLLKDAVVRGMGDLKASMRYMFEDAVLGNIYKVDTGNFFLCGVSAGAIIANTTAYLDDIDEADEQMKQIIISHGGMQGNSSLNTQYKPDIKAVFNSSGGLLAYSCIDEMDPSLISIHCPADTIMPYRKGWLKIMHNPVMEACGSYYLEKTASAVGLNNILIEAPGTGHLQYYFDSIYYDSMMMTSASMFQEIICSDSGGSIPVAISEPDQLASLHIYPNPANQFINIKGIHSGDMEIYNSSGILIKKETFNGERISISHLKSGMYFLKIRNASIVHRSKFIISR
jgi:hypothetical protein